MQSDSISTAPTIPTAEELAATLDAATRAHRAERFREAEKLYMRVLRFEPRNAEALNLLGVMAAQNRDYRRAREMMKAAMAAAPESADYRFQYAHILQLSGTRGVAAAYREALARDPHHIPSLVNLGNLLLRHDALDEAASCLATAAEVAPNEPVVLEGLALAQQRGGRPDAAIDSLRKAVALDPQSVIAQARLGTLLRESGRVEEACEQLRGTVARFPGNAALEAEFGLALLAGGAAEAASAAFARALAIDPRSVPALGAKPLAQRELGDESAAARLFDYDRLLVATKVTEVPGFADMASFNGALAEAVAAQAATSGEAALSLGGGGPPAVARFGEIAKQAAFVYFGMFKQGGEGFPLPLPRGCRLEARGRAHPAGQADESVNRPGAVVSGLYFARVPEASPDGTAGSESGGSESGGSESSEAESGGVEFGAGPSALKLTAPPVTRSVAAEESLLLLFPAYLWHRVLPHGGRAAHVTLAFDLLPLD